MNTRVLAVLVVLFCVGCSAPLLQTDVAPLPPVEVAEPFGDVIQIGNQRFVVAPDVAIPAQNAGSVVPVPAPNLPPVTAPVPRLYPEDDPVQRVVQQVGPRPHAVERHGEDVERIRRRIQGECGNRVRMFECYRNSMTGEPVEKFLFICDDGDGIDATWAFDNGERLLEGTAYTIPSAGRLQSILNANLCYEMFFE